MKLGELKKSLSRFPEDMNDSEVLIMFMEQNKINYDCLAFTGYTPDGLLESTAIILGTYEAVKNNAVNMSYPDGTKLPKDIIDDKKE